MFISDAYKFNDDVVELYALPRYVKILTEGPQKDFFRDDKETVTEPEEEVAVPTPAQVLQVQQHALMTNEDLTMLWGIVNIEDNNLPAPENIPNNTTTNQRVLANQLGQLGICPRHMEGAPNMKPRIQFLNKQPTGLWLFELFK